jgi:hypothetical protein
VVDAVVQGNGALVPSLELSLSELQVLDARIPIRSARYRIVPPDPYAGGVRLETLVLAAATGAIVGGAVAGGKGAVAGGAIGAAFPLAATGTVPRHYVVGNQVTFKLAEPLVVPPRF